jgi:hypothetical protein
MFTTGGGYWRVATKNIEHATRHGSHWRDGGRRKNKRPERQIPIQIKLLGSEDESWQKGAHSLLVRVTFQDLGYSQKAWIAWYKRNMHRTRDDWAADALERAGVRILGLVLDKFIPKLIAALRHNELPVRAAAYHLLVSYTGRSVYFPLRGPSEMRERHVMKWIRWWKEKGVLLYGRRRAGGNGSGRKAAGANGY